MLESSVEPTDPSSAPLESVDASGGLQFRVHPAIGIARVGNSEEYVIAPETMAGAPVDGAGPLTGGLPVRAGTESDPVRSSDLRDRTGALKRQAARFRIFAYTPGDEETWPRGDAKSVTEVTIGSSIAGHTVADIVWTVHLANKKANGFVLVEDGKHQGISAYEEGRLPPIRNAKVNKPKAPQPADKIKTLNDPARVRQLTIDPGPRTVSGRNAGSIRFDKPTPATIYDRDEAEVVTLDAYPKSFPADSFPQMDAPSGPIDTLGELATDDAGHLLVLGGYGRAAGWRLGAPVPLADDVNNNQWFDDASDGPVSATIVLDDGARIDVQGAWVTATDPSYAPQILNVVSLWDDLYDVWVQQLGLAPEIYDPARGGYQDAYQPTFEDQVAPIFQSAALQHWVVNLSDKGISAHAQLAAIGAKDDPATTPLAGLKEIFRNPFKPNNANTTLMPLHLGDAGEPFLYLRKTQYFFLERWNKGRKSFRRGSGVPLGPGETLDKATLVNCLGGRFSPGIDLTFLMREPALYVQPWQTSGSGPFRVNGKQLAYRNLPPGDRPLLTAGFIPRHVEDGVEPGDLSKLMALPWHTDYNSCATHPPSPNPDGNRVVFWSWPAQRPVAVYPAADVTWSEELPDSDKKKPQKPRALLPAQRWSLRGLGTDSPKPENWGRYQDRMNMLQNWQRIGVIMQAPSIDIGGPSDLPSQWYLETQSLLLDTGQTPVQPFPNIATQIDPDDARDLDPRDLFYRLLNVNDHPDVIPDARAFVEAWLRWAEKFSNSPKIAPASQIFFPYTEAAFQERLEFIYQELVDDADASDPADNPVFKTYEQAVTRIIQLAPFNLVDGAWLRNIGVTGPIDEARSLLYSVSMDELGDGDVAMNHCNIYQDLCHSVGYYPSDIYSREFASDPQFVDSAFTVPAFQLAISQFTPDYYPELLGMTVQLEWEVVDLKPTRDLMEYFGINPHFYVMHIGIDNSVNGHGARAADAVRLYLLTQYKEGGDAAVAVAWRRIWNGFVAFGSIGTFSEDLENLILDPPSLRAQMVAMFSRKADFGSRNHQDRTLGDTRINEWFNDPEGFLDALVEHGYVTPGDWPNSRMNELLDFEGGPMYRVFTDPELKLWANYVNELGNPAPKPDPEPPVIPPAHAMAGVIDQLRPVQQGVLGHEQQMLADTNGTVHTLAWWFKQPTIELMRALASPINDVITPGSPRKSRFLNELIAPTGPMGSVFNLAASPPNNGSCRDVVRIWISAGCPIPGEHGKTLRLNTPRSKRDKHPTGRIYGMGTIH